MMKGSVLQDDITGIHMYLLMIRLKISEEKWTELKGVWIIQ